MYFLIIRAGWLVTKIYTHYTFQQALFKKDFVVMNQVSRQKAKRKVEKDFYKLMNNSNFGNDCQNNIYNCSFKPIFDDIEEISFLQKYTSLYNNDVYKDFASPDIIKQQIEHEYNSDLMPTKEDDSCGEARRHYGGQKRARKLDAVESMIVKSKEKKIPRDCDKKQKTIYVI